MVSTDHSGQLIFRLYYKIFSIAIIFIEMQTLSKIKIELTSLVTFKISKSPIFIFEIILSSGHILLKPLSKRHVFDLMLAFRAIHSCNKQISSNYKDYKRPTPSLGY